MSQCSDVIDGDESAVSEDDSQYKPTETQDRGCEEGAFVLPETIKDLEPIKDQEPKQPTSNKKKALVASTEGRKNKESEKYITTVATQALERCQKRTFQTGY